MRALPFTRRFVGAAIAVAILTLGSGVPAMAAAPPTPHSTASAAAGDDREGPQFYTGVLIDVSGTVDGDVYASGQSVIISGDVTGDVIAAAQTITITGTVEGDVRLAGQDVTISGDVSRSGTIFAANIVLTRAGSLGDDLVGAAGDVRIGGSVGRDVMLSVGRLSINGSVGGDLTYVSDRDARITDGAVVGSVERVEPAQTPRVEVSPWAVFFGWFLGSLYAIIAFSLIALSAGFLLPRWLRRVTDHLVPSPWKALLVGFVACLAVPAAAVFLLLTVIGAPLALVLLLVWFVLLLASFVYGAFYVGRLLFRGDQHPAVIALVGGLILITALQIPWINVIVWLATVFFGLGAQLLEFHRQRPWSVRPAPDHAPDVPQSGQTATPQPIG